MKLYVNVARYQKENAKAGSNVGKGCREGKKSTITLNFVRIYLIIF